MSYLRKNMGTCSHSTEVSIGPDGKIEWVEIVGGCDGNLKGIASLIQGMDAREAITRMKGLTCGRKTTSCPDQIALALEEALAANN